MQILFRMGNLVMATITMAAIMESNQIKMKRVITVRML